MTKALLLDVDGVVISRKNNFSVRLAEEYRVPPDRILPFFENEFQQCIVGKADLKEELKKYLASWNWTGTVDELLEFWFASEAVKNEPLIEYVQELRKRGVACYLQTNNEKYRVRYLTETIGLVKLFDGVFASAELGYKKPEPKFWQAVLQKLAPLTKEEIMVWDDDQENVASAKTFGFPAEFYIDFDHFLRPLCQNLP